ncbi:MAG: HlyC/CorC family transporter [Parvularculaceae bacterium]|nr:HlyC/CorC family transporter [Parvularculaceae bacterium]
MSDAGGISGRTNDADEASEQGGFFNRLKGIFTRQAEDAEFADALDDGQRAAAMRLPRARREMIERVIAFDEKRVGDVMAPRADIVAVDIDTPLEALIKAFAEAGHSRLPVYRGDLDDPIGMVHIKDVVALIAAPTPPTEEPILKTIRRTVLYVPRSMRVTDLLLRMQASRVHMALVIDEFGGTDGLLTIEDLVEEIVGDINDEHDDEIEPTIVARQGGGWEADGRVELDELADTTGITIEGDSDEVDTIGGLVVALAGRVPQRGEVLSHPTGYDFEVVEADARKVRKVRIRRTPPLTEPQAQAGE